MSRARDLAIKEVDSYPSMKAWAFEDTPASSEQARDRYITNAGRADLVIWLIGVDHSMADGIITQDEEARLREFRDQLALGSDTADSGAMAHLDRAS